MAGLARMFLELPYVFFSHDAGRQSTEHVPSFKGIQSQLHKVVAETFVVESAGRVRGLRSGPSPDRKQGLRLHRDAPLSVHWHAGSGMGTPTRPGLTCASWS